MKYSFFDRASYIAASTEWKADYRALSAKIRQLKLDFKTSQREGKMTYTERLRSEHLSLVKEAQSMISTRHGMKEEAQMQYLADHMH